MFFLNHFDFFFMYSSLPNRCDVTAINYLGIFHLQLCHFSHHVYWKWPKLATITLLPGIMFSEIKESSNSASHNSVILATVSLKIRKCFRFSHKNVKIKLECTQKNKSFEWGIVRNCFENIYCQIFIWMNTDVLLIQFNSIE